MLIEGDSLMKKDTSFLSIILKSWATSCRFPPRASNSFCTRWQKDNQCVYKFRRKAFYLQETNSNKFSPPCTDKSIKRTPKWPVLPIQQPMESIAPSMTTKLLSIEYMKVSAQKATLLRSCSRPVSSSAHLESPSILTEAMWLFCFGSLLNFSNSNTKN